MCEKVIIFEIYQSTIKGFAAAAAIFSKFVQCKQENELKIKLKIQKNLNPVTLVGQYIGKMFMDYQPLCTTFTKRFVFSQFSYTVLSISLSLSFSNISHHTSIIQPFNCSCYWRNSQTHSLCPKCHFQASYIYINLSIYPLIALHLY